MQIKVDWHPWDANGGEVPKKENKNCEDWQSMGGKELSAGSGMEKPGARTNIYLRSKGRNVLHPDV